MFAVRGCRVLGVEPDDRMAAVARSHRIEVEVATFEEWDPAGRTFDYSMPARATASRRLRQSRMATILPLRTVNTA